METNPMTLIEKLTEAKAAYHQLMTGKKVVRLQKDGRMVDYGRANVHELRNYISDLEGQLGLSRRRPPAGVRL